MKEIVALIKQIITLHAGFEAGFKALPRADSLRHMISSNNLEEHRLGILSIERSKMDVLLQLDPYVKLIKSAQSIERKYDKLTQKEENFLSTLTARCNKAEERLRKDLQAKMDVTKIEEVAKKSAWTSMHQRISGLMAGHGSAIVALRESLLAEQKTLKLTSVKSYEDILVDLNTKEVEITACLSTLDEIKEELKPVKKRVGEFLAIDSVNIKQGFLNTLKTNAWPMVKATSFMRALRDIVEGANIILHGDPATHMPGYALGDRKKTIDLAAMEFATEVTPYVSLLENMESLFDKLKENVNDNRFLEQYQDGIDKRITETTAFKDNQKQVEDFYLTHKKEYVLLFQAASTSLDQFEQDIDKLHTTGTQIIESLPTYNKKAAARLAIARRHEQLQQEKNNFDSKNADQLVKNEFFQAFKTMFLHTGRSGYLLTKLQNHCKDHRVPEKQKGVVDFINRLHATTNLDELRVVVAKFAQDKRLIYRSSQMGSKLKLSSKTGIYLEKFQRQLNQLLRLDCPHVTALHSSIYAAIDQIKEEELTRIPCYNFDQAYQTFTSQFLKPSDLEANEHLASLNRELIMLRHSGGGESGKFVRMTLIVGNARKKLVNNLTEIKEMDNFISKELTLTPGSITAHPFSYHYQQLKDQLQVCGTTRPVHHFISALNQIAKDRSLSEPNKWKAMQSKTYEFYCEVRCSRNGNEALFLSSIFGRGSRLADKLELFLRTHCDYKEPQISHRANSHLKAVLKQPRQVVT